jgi:hypothetical protein
VTGIPNRPELTHVLLGDVEQLDDLHESSRLGWGHAAGLLLMPRSNKKPGPAELPAAPTQRMKVGSQSQNLPHLGG